MNVNDGPVVRPWIMSSFLLGLVLALGGLVVAFVVSFRLADRQYRLAMLSERQATTVGQIAELANLQSGGPALDTMLVQYRASITEESALLADDPELSDHQSNEAAEAVRLEGLARSGANGAAFRQLTTRIARQEAGEVVASRRELERLQTRTVALAVALAVTALLCALSAAWLLMRRNRSLEAMVQARTVRLAEVDRSRRLFFAKASHELRTPVTAMRGEAEVALLDPQVPAQTLRKSMSHILANAAFLGHRIDELLGLASADDGKLQLARSPLNLCEAIADAMEQAEPFARSVEVKIVRTGQLGPSYMVGDARWLRQGLVTVIENGLKFSPLGGKLSIDLAIGEKAAIIAVEDNGPGVMPGDLPRIFDAYYQSEQGRQRGGNGLGLALAQWVVEAHGGTISAVNRPEGGCTIKISLPLEAAP